MIIHYYKIDMSERRFVQIGDRGYIYEIQNCDLFVKTFSDDDFTIKSHLIDHVDDLKKYCPKNVLIVPVNILVIVEADNCHYVKIDDFRFAKLTNKMSLRFLCFDLFQTFNPPITYKKSFSEALNPSIFNPFGSVSVNDEIEIHISEFPRGIFDGAVIWLNIRNEKSKYHYLSSRELLKILNKQVCFPKYMTNIRLDNDCFLTKLTTSKEFREQYEKDRASGKIENITFKVIDSSIVGITLDDYLSIFPVEALEISKILPTRIVSVGGCVADIVAVNNKLKL